GARLNARALRLAPWLEPQDASHLGWVRRLLGLHRTVRWHRRLRRAEPTLPFFRARGTAANAGRLLPARTSRPRHSRRYGRRRGLRALRGTTRRWFNARQDP